MRVVGIALTATLLAEAVPYVGPRPSLGPPHVLAAQVGSPFVVRPDGSTERALQWVEFVVGHEPGMRDSGTVTISAWPREQVRQVVVEIESIRRIMRAPDTNVFPLPIEFDRGADKEIRYSRADRTRLARAAGLAQSAGLNDTDLLARGIVLHTDVAMLEPGSDGNILRHTDGRPGGLQPQTDHWQVARDLEGRISRRAGRESDLASWYHATLAYMAAIQHWNRSHADRALARFPAHAGLQFIVGCLHEQLAAPAVQAAIGRAQLPANTRARVGSATSELSAAADRFERALALHPGHTEARLRYGRVLTLAGRPAAAIDELTQALAALDDPVRKYWGQLFLGAALEDGKRSEAARTAYRTAAALFPRAQAPLLALAQLEASTGNRAGAAIAALSALPASPADRADPWWTYSADCGRDHQELLAAAYRDLRAARPPVDR